MKQKYEKPMQRNIRDLALARGSCLSGIGPLQQCNNGDYHAALCNTGSTYAYKECGPGTNTNACATGTSAAIPGG